MSALSPVVVRVVALVTLWLLCAAATASPSASGADWLKRRAEQRLAANAECMDCHSDASEEGAGELSFNDGTAVNLGVNQAGFDQSVHGNKLECRQCHRKVGPEYPHPEGNHQTLRGYQVAAAAVCTRCHAAYRKRLTDSVHLRAQKRGNVDAPTCVDCHGAHDVGVPGQPRLAVNQRCARCHEEVADRFAASVHGKALTEEDNPDVPVCTSCHGAHAVADTDDPRFRANSHAMCAQCHTDEMRMAPYGLSTTVVSSYLEDFHGASNLLYLRTSDQPMKPMVTCMDCHGAHDITSTRHGDDPGGVRKRLLNVCQECHHDATPSFAQAWVSHYEPTLASAPLVWAVKAVYRVMIPVIMTGLVLHILLHLWRLRTHR